MTRWWYNYLKHPPPVNYGSRYKPNIVSHPSVLGFIEDGNHSARHPGENSCALNVWVYYINQFLHHSHSYGNSNFVDSCPVDCYGLTIATSLDYGSTHPAYVRT